jgi:hypothetical protein
VAVLFVALPLVSACSGGDGDDGPSASVTTASSHPSTTSSSVALTPEQEVEAAYLRSWDVYAKAVRELDPAGLEESYTGDALDMVRAEVERYRQAKTPVKVRVEHDYEVRVVDDQTAGVFDTYRNHSVVVDRDGNPVEQDPDEVLSEIYSMRRDGETWKVARITRR